MPDSVNVQVGGNVTGNIVVGNNNFVVNTNYGTIVNQQAKPQVQLRSFAPQPPRSPRGFVNRTSELEKISDWVSKNEIILVYGADGLGKSALLRQASNLPAARGLQNGVILLDNLDSQGEAWGNGDVVQKLFDALFESVPPLKVDEVSARTYLSNTRPLILFDEIPLSPALQKLLPDLFPQGALMLASDVSMGADFQRLALGPLPRDEAARLLIENAGGDAAQLPNQVVSALCALLQDIPLAVTITGKIIQYGGISLEEAFNTLSTMPSEGDDPLPAALDKVYKLAFSRLKPDEKKLLAVAAQSPGVSISVDWLTAALGANIDQALGHLKDMGLLFANSPRLRLPPGFLIPARRSSVLDEDTVMGRLVDYLLVGVSRGDEFVGDEAGNMFGALLWAVRAGRPKEVVALGRALDAHLTLHGLWDRWGQVLELVLEASRQSLDRASEAWALHQLGTREIGVGSKERALELLRQALEGRRALGDRVGMAYTQHNIDYLIGPPIPPRGGDTGPQPVQPAGGRPLWLKLLLGFAGIAAAVILIVSLLPHQIPPEPPKPEPTILTPMPLVEITITVTLPPPDTDTPTPTETSTLTPTPTETLTPTPVPTPLGGSGRIVFQNGSTNDPLKQEPYSIHTFGLNGYDQTDVSIDGFASIREPAWSPDGRKLAVTANNDSIYSDIFTSNIDGSNWRLITVDQFESIFGNKTHATWSPDGKSIAFVVTNDSGSDIYRIDSNGKGGNLVNLTNSDRTGHFDYPEWSPDGRRIAFQAYVNGNWEIFVMNADGSNSIQLTKADSRSQWSIQPTWSPDSRQIAFTSNRSGTWDIFVMNRKGGDVSALTGGDYSDTMPDWSPDGHLIAFTSDRFGTPQIFVLNLVSSDLIPLTKMDTPTTDVDWRPVPGN